MTTISVTEARKKLYSLVDLTTESHKPIHITTKKGGAVLVLRRIGHQFRKPFICFRFQECGNLLKGVKNSCCETKQRT